MDSLGGLWSEPSKDGRDSPAEWARGPGGTAAAVPAVPRLFPGCVPALPRLCPGSARGEMPSCPPLLPKVFLRVLESTETVCPVATRWHLVFGNHVPFDALFFPPPSSRSYYRDGKLWKSKNKTDPLSVRFPLPRVYN